MRLSDGLRPALVTGLVMLGIVLAAAMSNVGGLAFSVREAVFDRVLAAFPRSGPETHVTIIDIDNQSLKKIGPWPWRRAKIAELISGLSRTNPAAITLDILLAGPDRQGPRAMLEYFARAEKNPALHAIAQTYGDDDGVMAAALAGETPVVLGLGLSKTLKPSSFQPLVLASLDKVAVDFVPLLAPSLDGPPNVIASAAAGLAVLSLDTDVDGWLRRIPLLFEVKNGPKAQPSLHGGFALEALRAAESVGAVIARSSSRILEVGGIHVPIDRTSRMRIYPRTQSYWTKRTIPAWQILAGNLPSPNDRTIFVTGSSAIEAAAFLPHAIFGAESTLRIQADAIDQLRMGASALRLASAPWSEWGAALAAGLLAVCLAVVLPPFWLALMLAGLVAAIVGGSLILFIVGSVLFDTVPALVAILAGAGSASLIIHSHIRANRALVEARFARYLAPAVVDILARNPALLRIQPERREVTAIFTDLEGFTPFTERTAPADLVATLNDYFEMIAKVAVDHGGMVDKIVGDAIHVFFNMPLDQPDHAQMAVTCARAIHMATEDFRQQSRQKTLGLGRTRIGVDTGMATVGDIGGSNKLDYTAHGEAINRAARLQGMARDYPSGILIGEGTASRLPSKDMLRLEGTVTPRGLSEPQPIYTFKD